MSLYQTIKAANLRSSPEDKDDTNKIITMPAGQWVHVVDIAESSWGQIWTIYKNTRYQGYIHLSLLRKRPSGSVYDQLRSSETYRNRLFADQETADLKRFLSISPPPSRDARPAETLSISRSREVAFDWEKVFSPALIKEYFGEKVGPPFNQSENIRYFGTYFIELWGVDAKNYDDLKSRLYAVEEVKEPRIIPVKDPSFGKTRFDYDFVDLSGTRFVLKHPLNDRRFYLEPLKDPITYDDFASWDAFHKMLIEKLNRITYVVPKASQVMAKRFVSEAEEVDLAPAIILRQYAELVSIEKFTDELNKQADKIGASGIANLLSDQEIDSVISGVLRMKAPDVERKVALERLADRASDLGYILNIESATKEYKYPDGSKIDLSPGKLYQPYLTRIYWVTEHTRVSHWRRRGFLGFGSSSGTYQWTERVSHEKEVIKYKEVPIDLDPWTERQDELLKNENLHSYRFEKQGAEYRTVQGESLAELIGRCERDETFRQQTAVWIPVYEQKLTRGEILTKYLIFKRPYKGIIPVRLPRLYVQEELTYRTAWQSSELGELVYTINLAPGEERTVTIDQKVSKQVEETRSTTSILDLTESDTLELSTEIEKEAKSSTESTRSSSWSASASGSYGPISGSASASGDSKTTTSQFARNMERVARKAAHNLTRKSRQEVKASTSIRADFSRSESTSIKIKNINEGRTLNLMFFRLYNLYRAGVYVDNIRILAEDGVELIAGSGLTIPRLYDLHNLEDALAVCDLHFLPYPARAEPGSEEYAKLFNAYWSYILDEFMELLGKEYSTKGGAGILHMTPEMESHVAGIVAGNRKPRLDFAKNFEFENLYAVLRREIKRIESLLAEVITNSEAGRRPLVPHELRVASPGLYVDTFMGVRPATEPYSEEMRAQQVRLRAAETAKEQSLANYYNSLAKMEAIQDSGPSGPAALGRILSLRSIGIDLLGEAPSGIWNLKVDDKIVHQASVTDGQSSVFFEWSADQDWLDTPNEHAYEFSTESESVVLHFVLLPKMGG